MTYVSRLQAQYKDEIVPTLIKKFEYTSLMQAPCITKICLNQGVGQAVGDRKMVNTAVDEMSIISGQKAVKTMSTKDVSNFKLRKDMPIGCKVTLRRDKMYDFLDRLISITLPRTRDFQGIKAKGFDGRGNFTFGIKEQLVFPEINIDDVKHINGMDITIVTSANTDEEAKALLSEFGFPFKNN
ncbi:MAG TPA: 50S ribosomal protein L5 [Flavobacteriales bacterium]|jgi:large subunit ribosomal protein L5|nr:50S ribosomal protein L5 [Flavobacteriales bacterium]|tara:strand:- start:42 stop:593 length:552 start_codon:yes stop_codon:yes gene_type:complete